MAPRIFLFEDDPDLRALLTELLQSELQATVVACTSIAEVLRKSVTEQPDLVVADFWGTSQLTLSEVERKQIASLGALVPTVLVSARQWALDTSPDEVGLAAVIKKPLDVDEFVTALRTALASRELRTEPPEELAPRDALSLLVLPWQ